MAAAISWGEPKRFNGVAASSESTDAGGLRRTMGVSTPPGATQLTVMRRGANSWAMDLVRLSMPPLDTA